MTARLSSVGDAGANNVDSYSVRREFERERFGKPNNARLGRGIMGAMLRSLKRAPGGQADNSPGTLREQMRHDCFRAEKRTDQVRPDDAIPLFLLHLFDRARGKNTRVVNENIHAAVFVQCDMNHRLH